MKRWILKVLVVVVTLYGGGRIYYWVTDDFRMGNIMPVLTFHPEWEISPLSAEERDFLNAILSQNFTYLDKGAQAYALVSEDQKYVLKLFKSKHFKPSPFVEWLSSKEFKERYMLRRWRKLERTVEGYKLAYDAHKESSGLIYVHFNPTDNLNIRVRFRDKIGFPHEIDPDSTIFVVQKRVEKTHDVMKRLLAKGDVSGVKRYVRQIFDMYLTEYAKGIYDRDHGVMRNTGFVEGAPIHLDVGKLSREDKMKQPDLYRDDLMLVVNNIKTYFQEYSPEHYSEILKDIDEKVKEIFEN